MSTGLLSREKFITTLVEALRPLDFVNAVWEGGAAAFGRVDEWSDIDLVADAADDRADDVWPVLERAIESVAPVELCFVNPSPPLGLHSQRFYRLAGTGPFLLLDLCVFRESAANKLLDPATHGHAIVHFDRNNTTKVAPTDEQARRRELRHRLESLRITFPLFQSLVLKELNRGNSIEAIAFYHAFTLRPLVELLRMRHCPARYQFHTRYVQYDLPRDVVHRLASFFFIQDAAELTRRQREAEHWGKELLAVLPRGLDQASDATDSR